MKKILVVAVTVLFLSSVKFSFADEASKKQLIEKLLTIMKSEEQYKSNMAQAKKSQQEMMANVPGYKSDPELEKMTSELMDGQFSYENMHKDLLSVYAEVFTEEELQGLIGFYESPIGQAYISKLPELTKRLMTINQKRAMESQAKMQQMLMQKMQAPKTSGMPSAPSMPAVPSTQNTQQ